MLDSILDFRDLFVFEKLYKKDKPKLLQKISKIIFYPIEKAAIKNAYKVITVTEGWAKRLQFFYPCYRDKILVIENGYDDVRLDKIQFNLKEKKNKIIIGNYGKLSYYSKKYAEELIKSLKTLNKEVSLLHVGDEELFINEKIEKYGVDKDSYHCTGFCDYEKGMLELNQSDILIVVDIRKQALGTKIYDYIYLNKPIIYIGPKKTTLSNLINSFEYGFTAKDEKEIIAVIQYIKKNNIQKLCSTNKLDSYARSEKNYKFLNIIESYLKKVGE